ncbi:SDR family oxidoreductase [Xanthobacter autotrophicus DSM 431]|uniref:SDR family oxidoreductase n=1 Tax=Xanthobacter nonsaccharivorans TaxID=3119912 RepID=UPI0037283348
MTGKVLVVTGGSRGIGAATVRLAAAEGYRIALNYASAPVEAERSAAAARALGAEVLVVKADVARPEEVERLFTEVDSRLGRTTHLVNNAGITGPASRFADLAPDVLAQVVGINVTGAMLVAQAAIRRISTAHGGAGGAIVNVSSMAARLGSPGEYVWYAASKGAIDSLTLGLARELARESVRVNAVAPGLIETGIHARSGQHDRLERLAPSIPLGRPGTSEEVARSILWLLSESASYVTGTVLPVSGGR